MTRTGAFLNEDAPMDKTVLVVGASGVVGEAALQRLAEAGAKVVSVSRRSPLANTGAPHLALDLMDGAACAHAIAALSPITHVVYAALFEKPGLIAGWFEADQIDTNDRMFQNLMAAVLAHHGASLRHVTLLQGTKAYGMMRPTPVAARENRDEAHHEPNFYWRQEERLRAARQGAFWTFTILRPQIIYGLSIGGAMNLIPVLGAYGALLKLAREPLHFPGALNSFVQEAVDADLLARVIAWAQEAPAARDEIFNVTNGDVYSWPSVWPDIADALGMDSGAHIPTRIAHFMQEHAADWDMLRASHGLAAPALPDFLGESPHYADMLFNFGPREGEPERGPSLVSTIKLRRAGFHDVVDTRDMFVKWLGALRARALIPA